MKLKLLSSAILLAMLSGCGNSSKVEEITPTEQVDQGSGEGSGEGSGSDHDHEIEYPLGRLAVSFADESAVSVYDLTNNELLETVTLTNPVSALYASPEGRYVVAIQRDDNHVEFIDGGIFLEAHDDHFHLEQENVQAVSFELTETKPTHYVPSGEHALVFFDGDKESQADAGFALISDEGITEAKIDAEHEFNTYMHGTGEIRGEYVISTLRDADAESTLPDRIALFELHDDHFHQEQEFEHKCPGLHGSVQTEEFVAFGCTDGIVAIEEASEVFTSKHIAYPEGFPEGVRIGKFIGHPENHTVIGLSRVGPYSVNLETGEIKAFAWQPEGVEKYLAYAGNAKTGNALVLDDQGYLNIFHGEHEWENEARIQVLEEIEEGATAKIIANMAHHIVYVAYGEHLYAVDTEAKTSTEIQHFDKPIANLTWVGAFEAEEHDHEHDH
ncbi:hypothetical protein [Pseudoalteromonas phenolica]|uniref:Lipoprotein n=1 Tax=Pseudoalteromonas phenolica TaxID=161398 RepID=A0A0S2K3N4_9GAMM|nr:hypothetical protein [Pseudoalteromonas phenolica]ALO43111.1 Lipoprotein [Pseudoalteromonas phenolica]MBE0355739.1 hypothetical protein [Pseudoalteromonas phenolica O-BC30]RXE94817.1 hypothetical protein D9981_17720 [Pseudoalteromonas phenolica O-BC30]TMO53248.1 hypothetical protein CWC21_20575 [Pseudoalteromonas phenolica]